MDADARQADYLLGWEPSWQVDARARLREKVAAAIHKCNAHWHEFDVCQSKNDYHRAADAVLDALSGDDLADLLGLRWEPFHSRYADEGQQATHRRLVGPWVAVEPT